MAINPPTLLLGNKIVNAKLVVFPKIVAVTPGSVQTKDNEPTVVLSIKVEFEALTGEHKAFCPLRTSATLPLQDLGDKWCMVAVDPLPKAGLAIPGMNMLITHLAIEKALSAAVQHKVPSIFPIRFQGLPTKPALKKKFGVYAFPELPRHVFIGPFSSDSFQDGHPLPIYLKVISSLSTFESPAEVAEKKRVDELKAKLLSYNVNFNPDLVIEPVRPNNKRSNTEETLCVNNRKKPREDVEISVIDNVVPNSVCHST